MAIQDRYVPSDVESLPYLSDQAPHIVPRVRCESFSYSLSPFVKRLALC